MSRPVLWLLPPLLVTGLVLAAAVQGDTVKEPAPADRLEQIEHRLTELEAQARPLEVPIEAPLEGPSESDVVGRIAPPLAPHVKEWLIGRGAPKAATLVVFFEPWCPYSKRAIQGQLPELQRSWSDVVEIVGLTQLGRFGGHESSASEAVTLVSEADVEMAIGVEADNTLADFFRVRGVPASAIVIDGVVRWRGHPMQAEEALEALFADR